MSHLAVLSCLRHVQLFVTPWTAARQAPLSMRFPSQEYWSGFPCPPSGDLPNPGIGPRSPTLQADSWSHLGIYELSTTTVRASTPPGTTHTQAHTHTHMRTHVHTCTHTGARTQQTGHLNYVKLCYFYISHLSSLTTLIKLEFDTTLTDKIRLCKVVSKNSSL